MSWVYDPGRALRLAGAEPLTLLRGRLIPFLRGVRSQSIHEIISVPNSEHLTSLAESIKRAKS